MGKTAHRPLYHEYAWAYDLLITAPVSRQCDFLVEMFSHRGVVDKLKKELRTGGNADFVVRVFPSANHAFFESKTGGNKEIPALNRFAPGMFETMGRSLKAHLQRKSPRTNRG